MDCSSGDLLPLPSFEQSGATENSPSVMDLDDISLSTLLSDINDITSNQLPVSVVTTTPSPISVSSFFSKPEPVTSPISLKIAPRYTPTVTPTSGATPILTPANSQPNSPCGSYRSGYSSGMPPSPPETRKKRGRCKRSDPRSVTSPYDSDYARRSQPPTPTGSSFKVSFQLSPHETPDVQGGGATSGEMELSGGGGDTVPRHKRPSHIRAEHKRRNKIQVSTLTCVTAKTQ